jgi:ribonuclease R
MTMRKYTDPYAKREAEKYVNPIASRECILDYLKRRKRFVSRGEIAADFGLETPDQKEALRRRLRAMERDGQIVLTRRKGYGLPGKMQLIRGRVFGHKDGYGFLIPDDKTEKTGDLFLNARQMQLVFHGDRVLGRVISVDKRGRREAMIVEVLERNTHSIVGRFSPEDHLNLVIPVDTHMSQSILITEGVAEPGQLVVVEITAQPSLRKQALGKIIEILGDATKPGVEVEVVIRNYGLPNHWPDAVESEVSHLCPELSASDLSGRTDLRDLNFVTIDGEDAKDFDDAVVCIPTTNGWRLLVAIADVSHYVKPNTALDREAQLRGNSVYFPSTVIPMLPEILSNELCSLKPNVDRLCMVCDMHLTSLGQVKRYQFYPAVMHSRARLTYREVTDLLADKKSKHDLLIYLRHLKRLYFKLHRARVQRGAIDFETTETQIIFGPQHRIEKIVPSERTLAHRIIEECMLLANVSAAHFILKNKIASLFRVHEGPSEEKLADLQTFLSELGLRLPIKKQPKPMDYAKILQKIKDRPDAHLIQSVLLRSMSQAIYSPDNKGHFGLAFDAYTHFTSPIRRYPDLIVHRCLRMHLTNTKENRLNQAALITLGQHCSMTERRADEASAEVINWLKCEFMQDHVGRVYTGLITHVTGFGLFVELKDIYVEGLLHITALPNDYYQFDVIRHRMRGERTGKIYRLGDLVEVCVARVDLEQQKIDFSLP